jgi:cytidine deaminase
MPMIDAYRDAHARSEPYPDEKNVATRTIEHNPFNPDWRQSVSVTYSFADGSAARSHAIQAALRPYRPTYFHFWQLKTFWHESKITDEDIEVHSFEEMETVPAMAVDQTPDTVVMVVKEMKAFRECYLETLKRENDVESFWLRKSKQPVLAVLLVQKQAGKFVLYRGTNMEVSMPTGSLCAERNAIGNALANDPGLKREDLLMVAVLSIQLPGSQAKKILSPPGMPLCRPVSSGKDGIDFAKEVAEKLKQHQIQGENVGRRSLSSSSFAGIAEERPPSDSSEEWEIDAFQADTNSPLSSPFVSGKEYDTVSGGAFIPELSLARSSEKGLPSSLPGDSTPQRRISLYQKKIRGNKGENMQRQKVLVQPLQVSYCICFNSGSLTLALNTLVLQIITLGYESIKTMWGM